MRAMPPGGTQIVADTRTYLDGFLLERPISAREALAPIASIFGFDGAICGGAIRFSSRAGQQVRVLTENDLVPGERGELASFSRGQDSELPRRLSLSFYDGEREYRPATVHARRVEGASAREISRDASLVSRRMQAQQRCDVMLQDLWIARETARFHLRPGLLDVEVGDLVVLPGATQRVFRIMRLEDRYSREAEAQMVVRAVYDHAPPALPRPAVSPIPLAGPIHAHVFSLGLIREGLDALQYAAVYADPWPGAVGVWRRSGSGFASVQAITRRAIIGETLGELQPCVTSRFDHRNQLTIRIAGGALSSLDDVSALSRSDALAVGGPDGEWEVITYAHAEFLGDGVWRLSRFVRGLGGEEHLSARTLAAGAPVIILDDAVTPLVSDPSYIGSEQTFIFADAASDYADDSAVEVVAVVKNVALQPYSPVHLRARRIADGIEISFIRRGRIDSDGWGLAEVPLGEEREEYRIDILEGDELKRVLSCFASSLLYVDDIADFGSPQTHIRLRIAQVSATAGPGFVNVSDVKID